MLAFLACAGRLWGQANLVSNPGFEQAGPEGFATDWAQGEFGKLGKTVFLDQAGAHEGQRCLRLTGTANTFTTCAGKRIAAKPDTDYWVCKVCGNTVEGEPPDECPVCKAKKVAFYKVA